MRESFLRFSTQRGGRRVTVLIEGIARGRSWWERASLTSLHSLQLWSYTERKTRVQGRVWAVSILKQVSFLQALILEHLCTWNKVVSATAFASFGLVKSLHRGSGKTLQRFCVNWCQTCAFEIMLFISQLFYKVFYWID